MPTNTICYVAPTEDPKLPLELAGYPGRSATVRWHLEELILAILSLLARWALQLEQVKHRFASCLRFSFLTLHPPTTPAELVDRSQLNSSDWRRRIHA